MTTIGWSHEVIVRIPPGTEPWLVDVLTESAFDAAWLMEQLDRIAPLDDVDILSASWCQF